MAYANPVRLFSIGVIVALSSPAFAAQAPAHMAGEVKGAASADVNLARPRIMEEAPPKLPKVSCNGTQMTISAENSTLTSVLRAVKACAGIKVDMPDRAAGTRIFEQIGPAPASQVLESLLSGTDFNYVIGRSDADPAKVESVLLLTRKADGKDGAGSGSSAESASLEALTPARRLWLQTSKNGRAVAKRSPSGNPGDPDADASTDSDAAATEGDDASTLSPMDAAIQAKAAEESEVNPNTAIGGSLPEAAQLPAPDPTKGTEDKITSMQQLFEQRRKLADAQSSAAAKQQ
jgi:hypothetical protein